MGSRKLVCAYPGLRVMFVPTWVENGCGLMDIRVGAFPLIEALVYMPRISIYLPILVRLDTSPFRVRFLSLVSIYKNMASNGLRVLGCVVRTYCRNGPWCMSVFVMLVTSLSYSYDN